MVTSSTTAAGKVLKVLGAFDRDSQNLSLSRIAQLAGMPLSTAHRVVNELAQWGALERAEDGTWHVGLRLWEVASLCPRGQILRDVALPSMQDLYEATHENIQLGVREGTELVFVERLAGRHSVDLDTGVGARYPLAATGMGRVLLAHAPAEIQHAVLDHPLRAFTSRTITDPAALRRELGRIRREHVVVSDRQLTETALSVAAPIRIGARGSVQAALGVVLAAESTDVSPQALRVAVLAAAREISTRLGGRAGSR